MRTSKALLLMVIFVIIIGCDKQAVEAPKEAGIVLVNDSANITEPVLEEESEAAANESGITEKPANETDEITPNVTQLNTSVTEDELNQRKEKIYSLGNKIYNITLDFVSEEGALFLINGEATRQIKEGETDMVGSVEIGVLNIWLQNFAGGIRKVEYIAAFYD